MEAPDKQKLSALFQALESVDLESVFLVIPLANWQKQDRSLFSGTTLMNRLSPAGKTFSTPHIYHCADTPEKGNEPHLMNQQRCLHLTRKQKADTGHDIIGFCRMESA
jgi:hypothetical protein